MLVDGDVIPRDRVETELIASPVSHMCLFDEGITKFRVVLDVTELGHTSPWYAKWISGSEAITTRPVE